MEGEFGLKNKPIIVKELEKTFRQVNEEKYLVKTTENEEVLDKEIIIRDLLQYDENLIEGVLSNEVLKKHFTKEVSGSTVIIVQDLIEVLETEIHFRDSYTNYANKIGLTVGGNFIRESNEVILDFPYKDSILKAGMTKEDVEKDEDVDEDFYHELIHAEERDQLFDEKILKNVKKYDENGVHCINSFSKDDNLIIKGNNLIALHSLEEIYKNEVRLIYLDVPYYFITKKEYDAFKYNSNFQLSTWLVFLKNRLEIAKKLLSEDGTIWIHVGEDGMHYLKVLADSIFGPEHFVGTMPRKTREGKNDVPFNFSQDFDFILIYTKADRKQTVMQRKIERSYIETDDFPGRPWRRGDIKQQKNYKERPNSYFDMVNPKTGKVYKVDKGSVWRVTKDTFDEWYENGYIGFPDDYDFMTGELPFRRSFKDEDEKKDKEDGAAVFSDYLLKDFVKQLMGKGRTAKDDIIGNSEFNYAKPESLMRQIIEVSTFEGDIVLDFFLGSGTTAAVAHKMNRKYIGVEQMDYIETITIPRLQEVINGEEEGISKEVNWDGGGSFIYAELMEKSRGYLEDIQKVSSINELSSIYKRMLENVDIDFRVNLLEIEEIIDKEEVSLEDLKRLLIQIIDKNQLYYNYSEIDDKNIRDLISNSDYEFNKSFYKKDGDLND